MNQRDHYINLHIKDFKRTLKKFIALKSISATGQDIQETVSFLSQLLKEYLSAKVKIFHTAGSPTLLAKISGQRKNNILFYGHYDVMDPGNLHDWQTDPFTLTEMHDRLYGRGVGDNKGQLLGQILGLYTYKQIHHSFPFNITFLIEGEEEQGSKHLEGTVKSLAANELADIDMAIVIDGSFNQSGQHVLRLGNRGVLGFEMTVTTGSQDNHSGNLGNIMQNPALILMKLINRLYDFKTQQVNIPGYYDQVSSPSQTERTWLKAMPFNRANIRSQTGIATIPSNKFDYYQRLMFKPTFNISGIYAGYTGQGMKTIIPHLAVVKIDCRLVAKQNMYRIQKEIERLIEPELSDGIVDLHYLVQIPPSKTSENDNHIAALAAAINAATGSVLIEPVMPGTVPNYVWTDILKVPVFTIPYANFDQRNHAPNENITVKAFTDGIRISYELLNYL